MRYLGGKSRTARRIVAAILTHAMLAHEDEISEDVRWLEPFMGGGSVTVEAAKSGAFSSLVASDIDPLVVAYWSAIRDGWVMPTLVTEDEYHAARANADNAAGAVAAHIAYNCSFGGKRWGGYARGMKSDGVTPRNFADESSRRDRAAAPYLTDVQYAVADYVDILTDAVCGDVVYCDPPYEGTTGYATGAFDHAAFWRHVQAAADRGAHVYVYEYACPEYIDSEVIWSNVQSKSVAGGASSRPRTTDNVFFIRPTS